MDYVDRDSLPLSSSNECKTGFEKIHDGYGHHNHDEL